MRTALATENPANSKIDATEPATFQNLDTDGTPFLSMRELMQRIEQLERTRQLDRRASDARHAESDRRHLKSEQKLAILQPFVEDAITVASYSLEDWREDDSHGFKRRGTPDERNQGLVRARHKIAHEGNVVAHVEAIKKTIAANGSTDWEPQFQHAYGITYTVASSVLKFAPSKVLSMLNARAEVTRQQEWRKEDAARKNQLL